MTSIEPDINSEKLPAMTPLVDDRLEVARPKSSSPKTFDADDADERDSVDGALDGQRCAHCGTPLVPKKDLTRKSPPATLASNNSRSKPPRNAAASKLRFCCRGCEFVYHTLDGLSLGKIYHSAREAANAKPATESDPARSYVYLDDNETMRELTVELDEDLRAVIFVLPGIHCAACVWLLEKLPLVAPGIVKCSVNFGTGRLKVEFRHKEITLSQIAFLLNSIGYPPLPERATTHGTGQNEEDRTDLRRIGVAALCAANTMMLAVSLFQSFSTGIEPQYAHLLRWLSALLATPAVFYSAYPFYRSALTSLAMGIFHIDLPIAIAIVFVYIAGLVTTITGGEYVYFDSVTALIFLLLVGRRLQRGAVRKARVVARGAWELFPPMVRIVRDGAESEIPTTQLSVGDTLIVRPGERIGADGDILEGSSAVDSSVLTGESEPTFVNPGTAIFAGTLNLDRELRLRITNRGAQTRLGRILRQLEAGGVARSPVEDRANHLSRYFIAGVLLSSVATFVTWMFLSPSKAFDNAVAVLIVTCPCALGLAIPAAVCVAIGRAAKLGILIKEPDALDRLAKVKTVFLDKTGTLTEGRLQVAETWGEGVGTAVARQLAAVTPKHAVARALVETPSSGAESHLVFETKTHHGGRGIEAVTTSGEIIRLGSLRWLSGLGVDIPRGLREQLERWQSESLSPLLCTRGTEVLAAYGLRDAIREGARELITLLHSKGVRVEILSGDCLPVVESVARALAIPLSCAHGDLFPEEKAAIVSKVSSSAMIGDGVNDALALRAAGVGIGVRGAIEATLEVAQVFIAEGNILNVRRLFDGAWRTDRLIRRNLTFAVVYNSIGGFMAFAGIVTPLVAAFVMPISSLTIIAGTILSRTFHSEID